MTSGVISTAGGDYPFLLICDQSGSLLVINVQIREGETHSDSEFREKALGSPTALKEKPPFSEALLAVVEPAGDLCQGASRCQPDNKDQLSSPSRLEALALSTKNAVRTKALRFMQRFLKGKHSVSHRMSRCALHSVLLQEWQTKISFSAD